MTWAPLVGLALGALTKWQISGLVRMETPVLYFYSQRPTTLSVRVDFPKGLITEWYPPAPKVGPNPAAVGPVYRNGSLQWDQVSVLPEDAPGVSVDLRGEPLLYRPPDGLSAPQYRRPTRKAHLLPRRGELSAQPSAPVPTRWEDRDPQRGG